jgi:hypothetical protein
MDFKRKERRRIGRPRHRYIDGVLVDIKAWRKVFGKPRPTLGCRATDDYDAT